MVVICVFGDVNWGGLEKGICNLCAQGGVGVGGGGLFGKVLMVRVSMLQIHLSVCS